MRLSKEEAKQYLDELITVQADLDVIDSGVNNLLKVLVKKIPLAFIIVMGVTGKLADLLGDFTGPVRFIAVGALMRAEIAILKKHLTDLEKQLEKGGDIEL